MWASKEARREGKDFPRGARRVLAGVGARAEGKAAGEEVTDGERDGGVKLVSDDVEAERDTPGDVVNGACRMVFVPVRCTCTSSWTLRTASSRVVSDLNKNLRLGCPSMSSCMRGVLLFLRAMAPQMPDVGRRYCTSLRAGRIDLL